MAKPTRITDETAKLIDDIFIQNPINDSFGIIINDISDHLPIFIIKRKYLNEITKQENTIQYKIINENTQQNFLVINIVDNYDFHHLH